MARLVLRLAHTVSDRCLNGTHENVRVLFAVDRKLAHHNGCGLTCTSLLRIAKTWYDL